MRKDLILSAVLFVMITGIIFIPFVARHNQLIYGDDIHRSYGFFRQFWIDSLKKGEIPWWNPYLFSGTPFIANPSNSFWYPPLLLFFFLPINDAYVAIIAVHIWLAMMGMYVLVNSHTDNQTNTVNLPALFSGIVFGLSGYFIARIAAGHIEIVQSAPYMPWVMWAYSRQFVNSTKGKFTVFVFFLSLQILAGYMTMTVLTLMMVGMLVALFCIQRRSLWPLIVYIAGIIMSIGVTAFHVLPIIEFVRLSIRQAPLGYDWASYGSIEWNNFLQLLMPEYFGIGEAYRGTPPNFYEQAFFVGRVTVVLSGIGLGYGIVASIRRKKTVLQSRQLLLWALGLVSVIYGSWISLGKNISVDLLHIFWQIIPFYQSMRIPPRHGLFIVFGLGILAVFGLQYLRTKKLQVIAILVVCVELFMYQQLLLKTAPLPSTRHDQSLIRFLQNDPSVFRLLPNFGVWVSPRDSLDFDSMTSYRLFSVTGYDPAILRNYYAFIDAVHGRKPLSSLKDHDVQIPYINIFTGIPDLLNSKYILHGSPIDPLGGMSSDHYQLVMRDEDRGYRLYENTAVMPRYFFVSAVHPYGSEDEIYDALARGAYDPRKAVGVVQSRGSDALTLCPQETSEENTIQIRSYSLNIIVMDIHASCDAIISSSDVYYPGWTLQINNEKAPLFQGNGAFRTFRVSKGDSHVSLRFIPYATIIGAIISCATLLFLAALNVFFRKNRLVMHDA